MNDLTEANNELLEENGLKTNLIENLCTLMVAIKAAIEACNDR